jgi:hypothetical protein
MKRRLESFAYLREKAERLGIPGWSRMRHEELDAAIEKRMQGIWRPGLTPREAWAQVQEQVGGQACDH